MKIELEKLSESASGEFAMKNTEMILKPIGVIGSPYKTKSDAPRQGRLVHTLGTIEIFPEYADGLKDIERYKHVILIYWFHLVERDTLITPTPDRPTLRVSSP